jgi:hypothetical protein
VLRIGAVDRRIEEMRRSGDAGNRRRQRRHQAEPHGGDEDRDQIDDRHVAADDLPKHRDDDRCR